MATTNSTSFETFDGGCACGAVRYRLAGPPMFVHCCHCTECQRLSGSAFSMNAPIEADRLTLLSGQPQALLAPSGSGRTQAIQRCPDCGVALWAYHPDLGEVVALVRIGTLDHPHAFIPGAHCFTRSKLPWVAIPDDVPAAEGHYDFEAVWPPASLERLASVIGG